MKLSAKAICCVAAFLFSLFCCNTALADDTLDDFPTPLGGEWGTLFQSTTPVPESAVAQAIEAIPGGYVAAGRQVAPAGEGLDYYTVLVRLDDDGNVVSSKTFDGEADHNEARDIIARYDTEETLTGFVITGARHVFRSDGDQEWDLPDIWLMGVGLDLEKDWEATFGDNVWSDFGNSLLWDGSAYIVGGEYTNPTPDMGYLLQSDGTAPADWELRDGIGAWNVPHEIHAVCLTADSGYALATSQGIYKLNAGSPPTLAWSAESDDFRSVIAVTDGYVATGSTSVSGDPDHVDLVLTKLNLDGTQAWRRTFGRSSPVLGAAGVDEWGREVVATADGGFAIVGTTESFAWHGSSDIWVLKTDAAGSLEWDVVLGDAGADYGSGIVQSADNRLVLTGTAAWEDTSWVYTVKLTGGYQPPIPAFTYSPASPFYIETTIAFDALGSDDPDGSIVLYEWDFGDGTSATGIEAEHVYITPGDYTVTLYVTDNHGVRRETSQAVTALALPYQWEQSFGAGRDTCYDLTRTPDGGFLLSGLDTVSTYGNLWVMKLDSLGNIIWEQKYADIYGRNDAARKGIVGHDGNYIIAGFRDKEIAGTSRDMRILKLNADTGVKIWEKFFDIAGSTDDAFDVKQVPGGGYIVVGTGLSEVGDTYSEMQLLKLDEDGNQLWRKSYSDAGDTSLNGHAVTPTLDGGYLAVGSAAYSVGDAPIVVIKTNAAGEETWRETLSHDETHSGAKWVHQAYDDNYVIAGTQNNEYMLRKLDSDGDTVWAHSWGTEFYSDFIENACVTPDNGYLLAGTWSSSETWYDVYLARTDSQGNLAWERTFGGAGTTDETGQDVVYLPDGSIVILASADYYATGTWLFKLGGNQLPTGSFTALPAAPAAGVEVTFTADVSDPDGSVAHMTWRFGQGEGDPVTTIETSTTHTFTAEGTYRVSLTVVDNDGGEMLFTQLLTVTGGVVDLCPDDPLKTAPGMCGCGYPDDDTDVDTVCDHEDNCPAIANTSQDNLDGDDLGDACDADADGDGYDAVLDGGQDNNDLDADVNPSVESGPAGDQPDYDGNGDGTADADQAHVASMPTHDGEEYVTLASPDGTLLSGVNAEANPSPGDAPDMDFPFGFFSFTISDITPGGSTTVTIYLPAGETVETYYKYGPTPSDASPHWYEFTYDGTTGAQIAGNVITLHFVDGLRGDDDLDNTNATVADIGAPAVAATVRPGTDDDSGGGGGGGGGCFIDAAGLAIE